METNKSTEEEEIINTPYKELIGCLLFMSMNNQSNITYAMPTISLWKASKRVLRYLKRTPVKGLNYRRTAEEKNLVAYGDADWAADKVDRNCTSGCAVFYCGSLIHWFSMKQTLHYLQRRQNMWLLLNQHVES